MRRIASVNKETLMVANALIADETGKVKLCLWNEQTNYITQGDTIQVKNATVTAFKGEK